SEPPEHVAFLSIRPACGRRPLALGGASRRVRAAQGHRVRLDEGPDGVEQLALLDALPRLPLGEAPLLLLERLAVGFHLLAGCAGSARRSRPAAPRSPC